MNLNKSKTIIWDLDGTLIDSKPDIFACLNEILLKHSLSADFDKIKIGPPLNVMLQELFPNLPAKTIDEIIVNFRKNYANCGFNNTKPFCEIENCLNMNANHYLATSKPLNLTDYILGKLNWQNKFVKIFAGIDKTEVFAKIKSESSAEQIFSVGDSASDAIAAKNNGIIAYGALWGYGSREELTKICDMAFETAKELWDFLYLQL